jgi:hypothetical protein
MAVVDLRWSCRMAVVLIPVCEIVRLCRSCGIHLLHLGKRLAHASEGHRHLIRCTLCLAACRYQTVQFVIGIGMAEGTAQLGLAASLRRVYDIGDAQDVVHCIIPVLIGHDRRTGSRKVHHLQTFTLLVICIGSLRAITEFRIDRMTLLDVTNLINNITIKYVFLKEWYPCVSSFF